MSGFYVDPACPFAWLASKWARMVQAQRDYTAGWRFISLWMINPAVGCDSHFPPGYEASHAAGLKLLRVAARTRPSTAAPLYAAVGARMFDTASDSGRGDAGTAAPASSWPRNRPGGPASRTG
jgi:mycothiol-dependent nitroreductase-like protein